MTTKIMFEKVSCGIKNQNFLKRIFSAAFVAVLFVVPLVHAQNDSSANNGDQPSITQNSSQQSSPADSSQENSADIPSSDQPLDNSPSANAQALSAQFLPPQNYLKAKVIKILEDGTKEPNELNNVPQPYQKLQLRLDDGTKKGTDITVGYGEDVVIREDQKLKVGDIAVVAQTAPDPATNQPTYYIYDTYRLPPLWLISFIFFAIVIFFGRLKGFTSFIGLLVSILVLAKIIVPAIIAGYNPFVISLIGSFLIALTSLYLAHGFNKKTTIALISTVITLVLSAICSLIFVELTRLTGAGSDDAFYLQFSSLQHINLKGLLLGGIMIGSLGVLDDVTTGQTAAIYEIKQANPRLTFKELYKSGLAVGQEHIASLVNTLVLAYAGAGLPLFLIFSGDAAVPFWVSLNSESIVEEIVRSLVGSTALVFAVPISTFLAAYYFSKKPKN